MSKASVVPVIFFDSWGWAYATCEGSHPDASAFGPTGIARRMTTEELYDMGLWSDIPDLQQSPYNFAFEADRLEEKEEEGDWSILKS